MKYIITEKQNMALYVRRRVDSDFDLIWDIVDEGVDLYLCEFDNFDDYFTKVVEGSAMTYLFHYFENHLEEGYPEMEKYLSDFIRENFTTRITEFWDDNKEDC